MTLRQQNGSSTFFVGAGLSIESDFPAALSLIDRILKRIAPDEESLAELRTLVDPPFSHRRATRDCLRFEVLLDVLVEQVDPELSLLEFIAEVRRANPVHLLLADRGCRGDVLVTTNLDSLLEEAVSTLGGLPRTRCRRDDFSKVGATGASIFKLHGSCYELDCGRAPAPVRYEELSPKMKGDDLRFYERGPSVPPDEPTALNEERAGHGAKHEPCGLEPARRRGSWEPRSGISAW